MYAEEDLSSSKRLVKIRDPIRQEDRDRIAEVIRMRKIIPDDDDFYGGQDRSFDRVSDTYGNSFTDFTEWPNNEPMDAQVNAEFFIVMCFTDAVIRMMDNKVLTGEQAESIIWMARLGMLTSAAATVNWILNKRKEGDADAGASGKV